MNKINKIVGVALLMGSLGCFPRIVPYSAVEHFFSPDGIPDYSNIDFWAAHPLKKDPSDSIPTRNISNSKNRQVDVFFLYPTSYTDGLILGDLNAKIDDRYLNKKTDYTAILYQASVFNSSTNVYAPRYRQAHISMYYSKDTPNIIKSFDLAYADVKKAFLYYLDHFNNGKPFIIASHSQGTTHATRLIKECIDGKEVQQKLIAAYLIGLPLKKDIFKNIPICKDSNQVGCFISWRTYRMGYTGNYVSTEDTTIAVVNPLSWQTDTGYVSANQQEGSILYNFRKVYRHTHGAQVKGNALFIDKPNFFGSFLIRMKNYHAGDYNLFYFNIQQNIGCRIKKFLNYY